MFVVWLSAWFTIAALIVVIMAIWRLRWRGRIAATAFLLVMLGVDSCEVEVLHKDPKAWDRADHCGATVSKWGVSYVCLP